MDYSDAPPRSTFLHVERHRPQADAPNQRRADRGIGIGRVRLDDPQPVVVDVEFGHRGETAGDGPNAGNLVAFQDDRLNEGLPRHLTRNRQRCRR